MKNLLLLFYLLFTIHCIAQDITNTLAPTAKFIVKDASNNYLTLDQSTGQVNVLRTLRLENTTSSTTGAVFKGVDRFIHNYGTNNTFLGINSGNFTLSGFSNTALGVQSLHSITSGSQNIAMGNSSLANNTTGFSNTALGYSAGSTITTGTNLTCLGYDAEPTSGSAANQITLGSYDITSLRCAVTTITSLSDERDKKNIKDLNLGIEFLMKIRPRQFNWDKREWYGNNISDGTKMKEEPTAGFIAQELDEAQTTSEAEWLNLVLKDNPEKWEATPGNLLPIMVKAIQDLKAEKDNEIKKLKTENEQLKSNNEKLSSEIESLKSVSEKLVTLEQIVNELISNKQASYSVNK
jgi:hypothetical protein